MNKKISKEDKKEKVLKEFDIDFDELKIKLPNNAETTIIITDQLLINKDLPTDILSKMSKCAAIYARYGNIRGDLTAYQSLINDRYDLMIKNWKAKARIEIGGKPSETLVEEKAVLAHIADYRKAKKKIYEIDKALEKIKRVMKAIEIQAEMARSIASYIKKEIGFTEEEPTFKDGGRHGKFSSKE